MQLGALTTCVIIQRAADSAVSVTLVPAGIPLTTKLFPPVLVTVPEVVVTVIAFDISVMEKDNKSTEQSTVTILIVGLGLTVILKFVGVPGQVPNCGVTVTVDTSCMVIPVLEVKLILPAPLATSPVFVLLLVQLNALPAVPENIILTGRPAQTVTLAGIIIVGVGLMVSVTAVLEALTHPVPGSRVSA